MRGSDPDDQPHEHQHQDQPAADQVASKRLDFMGSLFGILTMTSAPSATAATTNTARIQCSATNNGW